MRAGEGGGGTAGILTSRTHEKNPPPECRRTANDESNIGNREKAGQPFAPETVTSITAAGWGRGGRALIAEENG